MATSFLQKLRLGLRGWNRRRAEAAAKREAEFLARETAWAKPAAPRPVAAAGKAAPRFDLEGLQVAYLDDSGRIEHYLDLETGDVLEFATTDTESKQIVEESATRYRRIPTRTPESEALERQEFVTTVERMPVRANLELALRSADPAGEFRKALAQDRAVERAWYNFKNRRAAEAIERWLREQVG